MRGRPDGLTGCQTAGLHPRIRQVRTVYSRFRCLFDWSTHAVATRFCYIDYAREIAIVAEIGDGPERRLIGIGRLVADPSHEEGEYAVLVVDAWQHKELGGILTDYCTDIARDWKLKRIVTQTTTATARWSRRSSGAASAS